MAHTRAISGRILCVLTALLAASALPAHAVDLRAERVHMPNAPAWLDADRVTAVVNHVSSVLSAAPDEVTAYWYSTQAAFRASTGAPDWPTALYRSDGTIHLGPRVTSANFNGIFGHELTHAVIHQSFGEAVPKWLEEGLANEVGGGFRVDYRWLATQPRVPVRSLVHDINSSADSAFKYESSTAVIEMLASHCSIAELMLYSKGGDVESNIPSRCGITNLDEAYSSWLAAKARGSLPASAAPAPAVASKNKTTLHPKAKAKAGTPRPVAAPAPVAIKEGGAQPVDFGVGH